MIKKLPALAASFIFAFVFATQTVSAQDATGSATGSGTLPATGVETPLIIVTTVGTLFIASGFLFKKLQAETA